MDPQPFIDAVTAVRDLVRLLPAGTGEAAGQVIGLTVTDPVSRWRQERERANLTTIAAKSEQLTAGLTRSEDISAKVAEEIFSAAKDEDREELQDMWAALIARAVTGDSSKITRDIIDIVKKFEPLDALVLDSFRSRAGKRAISSIHESEKIKQRYSFHDVILSVERLYDLKCVRCVNAIGVGVPHFQEGQCFSLIARGSVIMDLTSPPTKVD